MRSVTELSLASIEKATWLDFFTLFCKPLRYLNHVMKLIKIDLLLLKSFERQSQFSFACK